MTAQGKRKLALGFACWAWAATLGAGGEAGSLKIAAGSMPESWGNPFSSTSITRLPLQSAVFDPLTFVDSSGALRPWLAENWERTGPTGWTIRLRAGVTFSNGAALTSAGVVAAFDYLLSEQGKREAVARELADIVAVRAIDALAFALETRAADPLLPYRLSLVAIPEPAAWRTLGREGFTRAPVGTGPLTLGRVAPNRIELRRNVTSWRKPELSNVTYLILPEPTQRRTALVTGAADVAITSVLPSEFDALRAEGGTVLIDRIPAVVAVAFNTQMFAPFRDERVRRALTHAVNREAIVAAIMGGETVVASQPAGRSWFGYNPHLKPLAYDPEKARALLREAGLEKGFAFDFLFPSGAVAYPDVFQTVAADLARVGVVMTARAIPQQKLFENIQTGVWDAPAAAIPFSTPVFDALYPQRQHSCLWHAPWFCDPAFSAGVAAAFDEGDLDRRRAATQALMARAHDMAQALFLYETVSFTGLGPRVVAFPMDFSFIRYEGVRLKE
jgi:peptide/nickel transport system substrate-binding protein